MFCRLTPMFELSADHLRQTSVGVERAGFKLAGALH